MARILVIDDDEGMRTLLQRVLTRAGHETVTATNGHGGMKVLTDGHVDLIITDLIMPGMEGVEFMLGLRRAKSHVPIIAMTGGGRVEPSDYLQLARFSGASKTLAKPFEIEELLGIVDTLLARQSTSTPGS